MSTTQEFDNEGWCYPPANLYRYRTKNKLKIDGTCLPWEPQYIYIIYIYIYIIYICISDLHTISRHEPCNVKPITDLKNDDGCETHLSRNNLWPQTGSWMCCTIYLLQKVDLSIRKRRISRRKPCARNEFVLFASNLHRLQKKQALFERTDQDPRPVIWEIIPNRGICAVYPIKHLYWAWFIHGFTTLVDST